jgi:UDP:flavonoid glycosyltransferase YjiC (YdhE family)
MMCIGGGQGIAAVVPHLFDQFYFGRRIHELGVGTRPIPRHKLRAYALNNALDTLLTDDTLHTRVDAISQHVQAEAGVTNLVTLVDKYLGGSDRMTRI